MTSATAPIRVHLKPTGLHSRAMVRIAAALRSSMPAHYIEVGTIADADLVVLYVISDDAVPYAASLLDANKQYAVVQCCYVTAATGSTVITYDWQVMWSHAAAVWSYLGLPFKHYLHMPLGVDDVFRQSEIIAGATDRHLVLTTGYVNGDGCEAISDVWRAAGVVPRVSPLHIGPARVEGMSEPDDWLSVTDITDTHMLQLYRKARFVSGLRYIEGFELPAAEAACCGATPIVFDQPDMRWWYGDLAIFVPETGGESLVSTLSTIFSQSYDRLRLGAHKIAAARTRFDWSILCGRFWAEINRKYNHLTTTI